MKFTDKPAQFFSGLIGLFCTAILCISLFIEHLLKIQPCILCVIQRVFFFIILIMSITYFVATSITHTSNNTKQKNLPLDYCFLLIVALFSILGGMVAARQSWLQIHSGFTIPSCSSGLSEMLQEHSIIDLTYMAIKGKLECSAIGMKIFGLSLANWGLINFVAILLLDLIVFIKILLTSKQNIIPPNKTKCAKLKVKV